MSSVAETVEHVVGIDTGDGDSRRDAVLDVGGLEPQRQTPLADPEVLRDLRSVSPPALGAGQPRLRHRGTLE